MVRRLRWLAGPLAAVALAAAALAAAYLFAPEPRPEPWRPPPAGKEEHFEKNPRLKTFNPNRAPLDDTPPAPEP